MRLFGSNNNSTQSSSELTYYNRLKKLLKEKASIDDWLKHALDSNSPLYKAYEPENKMFSHNFKKALFAKIVLEYLKLEFMKRNKKSYSSLDDFDQAILAMDNEKDKSELRVILKRVTIAAVYGLYDSQTKKLVSPTAIGYACFRQGVLYKMISSENGSATQQMITSFDVTLLDDIDKFSDAQYLSLGSDNLINNPDAVTGIKGNALTASW